MYAFDQGGAAGAGLIGFLRVLPAALALPLLGTLADRMSRRRMLVVLCLVRASRRRAPVPQRQVVRPS